MYDMVQLQQPVITHCCRAASTELYIEPCFAKLLQGNTEVHALGAAVAWRCRAQYKLLPQVGLHRQRIAGLLW